VKQRISFLYTLDPDTIYSQRKKRTRSSKKLGIPQIIEKDIDSLIETFVVPVKMSF